MDDIVINNREHIDTLIEATGGKTINISVCRVTDGQLRGGVMFNNYRKGESIEIHIAGFDPHWINRDMIYVAFHYPFNQLGVKRIFGRASEGNMRALAFHDKTGFRRVARIEGVYRGGIAQIISCLERKDCRFLDMRPRVYSLEV